MSNKGQDVPSQQVATTPRRLRSGTHYGDDKNQLSFPQRKDSKKSLKESSHPSDSDTTNKMDKIKTSKNKPLNHEDKSVNRSTAPCSPAPTINCSQKQHQKGQTLKAILESIEPNLCLKSKSSKRKTLRDLLDQKMFKDKKELEQKNSIKEGEKQPVKPNEISEKQSSNKESRHLPQIDSENGSVADAKHDSKLKLGMSAKLNTAHTQTASQSRSLALVKREPPDDYWAMKMNYGDKGKIKNSSVELRIKADGPSGHSADRSQTFRISCSRPETLDNSPTALNRNMKPDIVLKVRPRSSSLSALNRSASDTRRPGPTYKATGRFQGHLDSQSTIFSTISPLSFKSKSSLQLNHETNSMYGRGIKHRYHYPSSSLPAQGTLLQECFNRHNNVSASKSLNFDQLGHGDVVEESKLPPVANTVELLSEPYYDNSSPPFKLTDYSESFTCQQSDDCTGSHGNSPEPPVLEPVIGIQTAEKYRGENYGERAHERKDLNNESDLLWEMRNSNKDVDSANELFDGRSPAVTASVNKLDKEGSKRDNHKWIDDSDSEVVVKRTLDSQSRKSRSEREANSNNFTKASLILEESGSRRRRKGRPSRRAKTERRWQTADGLSPKDEEREGEQPSSEERNFSQKTAFASSSSTTFHTRKGAGKPRQVYTGSAGRRARKSLDLETLWANSELDTHAFLLWASENRREVQRQNPEVSLAEVEALLSSQWRQLLFSSKLQFLCRARDADTDHNKHTVRKKRVPVQKKTSTPSDGRSVYEEFLRLSQERQKDLLRKWLRFFQKMLPRLEYQDFISDFKKACKSLQLRPMPARRKNARLRNLDPSHYHMLFEKIRETRPRVISVYNKRKAREEQLLSQSFSAMIKRLIADQPWPFVRGCRSKVLGELLKDIQQLEVEEVLAQIDLPLSLTSADLQDPLLARDLDDQVALSATDVTTESPAGDPGYSSQPGNLPASKDAPPRKGPSCSAASPASTAAVTTSTMVPSGGPAGDAELPDSPFVLSVLDSLRHAADLPLLDQRCLDSVFLGPPTRSRGQSTRDTQFQNSATYRRTLLYKHIQPLLDARGMPLPSSALYHSHSAQYFYPDDR